MSTTNGELKRGHASSTRSRTVLVRSMSVNAIASWALGCDRRVTQLRFAPRNGARRSLVPELEADAERVAGAYRSPVLGRRAIVPRPRAGELERTVIEPRAAGRLRDHGIRGEPALRVDAYAHRRDAFLPKTPGGCGIEVIGGRETGAGPAVDAHRGRLRRRRHARRLARDRADRAVVRNRVARDR